MKTDKEDRRLRFWISLPFVLWGLLVLSLALWPEFFFYLVAQYKGWI